MSGWFDEQIRERKLRDDEILSEAYTDIAGAVVGRRLQQAWQDESYAARTALEEICKYYRIRNRDIPQNITDLNSQLDYVFQPCGIGRRVVKLRKGWEADAIGAMLGTRRSDGKVVALLPGRTGGYTVRDLETGKTVKIDGKNEDQLESEALVFYRPLPLRAIRIRDLIHFMLQTLTFNDLLWYFLAMGAMTLTGLALPKLTHMLFQEVVQYSSRNLLLAVMIFMVCLTVSKQMLDGVRRLLLARIGTRLNLAVRSASMMRLLSLPTGFFKNYTAGELNQHMSYLNQLCDLLVNAVFSVGVTGAFSLAYISQIVRYTPALVLPALLVMSITLLFSIVTIIIQMNISRQAMELTSKEQGMVYSLITGISKIRLSGSENRAFARWGKLYSRESELLYHTPAILKYHRVITLTISLTGTILFYYISVKEHMTAADYYTFHTAYSYMAAAFEALAGIAQTIAVIRPVLQIIRPIMDAVPETAEDREVVTRLSGRIELSHVTFQYAENEKKILDDVSLKIRAGQYVAIVGQTGCGKSTLMRILMGFEKPRVGAVYYDGKDLEKLDKKSLRRRLGVVLQEGKLIRGDIYSNITIAAPWLTLDDAWEAAEIAGIADDIRAMPMGMHTIIQEGAGGISGGQRQRIMIARAVASRPRILFLDEATSALDNLTQKHVSDSLEKLKCTRIVIAHRLSTIRQCDRIILLEDGRIAEDGTYDQLISLNGRFAQLVERQRVDF